MKYRYFVMVFVLLALYTACAGSSTPAANPPNQTFNRAGEESLDDEDSGYYLIQFNDTPSDELLQQLTQAGITFYDPVRNNIYQVHITAGALASLDEIRSSGEIISIKPILPETKVKSPLDDPSQLNPAELYPITVQFYEELTAIEQAALEELMIVNDYSAGVIYFAEGEALGEDLMSIAEFPFVKLIEKTVPASGG